MAKDLKNWKVVAEGLSESDLRARRGDLAAEVQAKNRRGLRALLGSTTAVVVLMGFSAQPILAMNLGYPWINLLVLLGAVAAAALVHRVSGFFYPTDTDNKELFALNAEILLRQELQRRELSVHSASIGS